MATFLRWTTPHWRQPERGGVLFSSDPCAIDGAVVVAEVSEPHPRDRGGRHWLELNHARCRADIQERFRHGVHFIGYWHTHPERCPRLSRRDLRALASNLTAGGHELDRLLAIVVGFSGRPADLCVAAVMRSSRQLDLLTYVDDTRT